MEILQSDIDNRYAEVENYKADQLSILQAELDQQLAERLALGFEDVEDYKEEQLNILQKEVDLQVEARYTEADQYKQEQLESIQSEIDEQIEKRYAEVQQVVNTQADEQVGRRIKEEYENIDSYKKQQLETLQSELDDQVDRRYKEADQYKETQIEKLKADLKSKFNIDTPSAPIVTTDNVVRFLFEKEADEDTVFKAKLAVFNKPEVKNHEDRNLKMKIRKAKTIPELFAAYHECLI